LYTNLEAWLDDDPMVNEVQTLSEKIRQRRIQMLVHSYLYYALDENIVDDYKWQQWADELVELQKQKKAIGFYDKAFSDWSGATGTHLPFDPWVVQRAKKLLAHKNSD
jgi:hypothetical protein